MRILFIHHGRIPGGAPISLSWTIKALEQLNQNYQIKVWCVNNRMKEFFETTCKVEVELMPEPLMELGKIFIGWTPFVYKKTLNEIGTSSRYVRGRIQDFKDILKSEKPDLIHLNSGTLFIPAIAAKQLDIPIIWHIREVFGGSKFNLRRIISGKFVRSIADHVITISDIEKEHIGGAKASNVTTVYNFVDVEKFKPTRTKEEICQELGLDPSKPIVISVGGSSPRKGLAEIIDSVDHTDAQYIIAGPEPSSMDSNISDQTIKNLKREDTLYSLGLRPFKFENYQERVRLRYHKCSSKERIRFIGHKNDIENYICAADALLFAGTVPHFPRPVYEAWLLKKPVVVFPVKGICTEVKHGQDGFVAANINGIALGKEILKAFDRPISDFKKIGEAGHQKAIKRFRSDINVQKISQIIEKLLRNDVKTSRRIL